MMRPWQFRLLCVLFPQRLSFEQLLASQQELQRIDEIYRANAVRTFTEKVFYRAYPRKFEATVGRQYAGGVAWSTRLGEGVRFGHGFNGVHIAHAAKFGHQCLIMQNVTIGVGVRPDGSLTEAPVIGDDVFIGAGANIIGNCIIGDGARIGAGVTLTNVTIPPGAVIVNKSAYDLTNKRFIYPQD